MTKKLQIFDFDKSHYERPNQKWVCGRLEHGCPCHVGPDTKGRCRAVNDKLLECTPWKDEDRWKCARPKSLGGACENGPSPTGVCCRQIPVCQPKLSHRAKRGRVALYFAMTAVATLFIFLFGIYTTSFASPGSLTAPHSAITAKLEGQDDCSICHTAGKGDALAWVGEAFAGHNSKLSESHKCLDCHRQQGDKRGKEAESFALRIHGISDERLQSSTEKVSKKKDSVELFPLADFTNMKKSFVTSLASREVVKEVVDGKNKYHQVACSTCHREHHGRDYNLTKLTNEQCQTCHSIKFSSFAHGHPMFDHFPYERRTRIMFDHTTHFGEYFKQKKNEGMKNIPNKCNACHKLDEGEHLMVVKTFEQTCIQCHEKDILKQDEDIPVIRFPGFLMEDFYAQSKKFRMRPKFNKWPSVDEEDTGEATDFMRMLLSKEKAFEDQDLSEYLETWISDIVAESPADEEKNEIKAINAYVSMIQGLCDEIAKEDTSALKERLEKILKISVDNETLKNLFPNVADMLQVVQARVLPPINPKRKQRFSAFEFEEKELPTGWYFSEYTLKYRPAKHGDTVMKTWLELMARSYNKDDENKEDEVQGNTHYVFQALNRCVKCHSIDKSEDKDAVWKINWKPNKPSNQGRFNRFSHAPHLALLDDVGCVKCHTLKKTMPVEGEKHDLFVKDKYNKIYENKDPHKFMSNFEFMKKDLCSQCHVKSRAGDNCTLCHNYHVTPFAPALNTTIEEIKKKVSIRHFKNKMQGILPQKEVAKK
ncbi:hypothetical protein [Candidatus Uabimicrobium sp. HlEnr_7]|uniref:hypothetical protein n=1 Tax=Candidatus Uabimicrobium helgolandensis TaxID=3095367 RepID=UPI0035577248